MAHDSKAIANKFVKKSQKAGRVLTIMPLLKFVYFAHGWTLGYTGKPLIKDKVEAWTLGPVIPEVYHSFRSQGVTIKREAINKAGESYSCDLTEFEDNIISSVYDGYSVLPAFELSNITHRSDSPWTKYRRNLFDTIPNRAIREYYEKRAQEIKDSKNE